MSWDGIIMRFGDVKTIDEYPANFEPPPIGDSLELKVALRRLFPIDDHRDESSHVEGDDFWLELNHGCHTDNSGNVSAISVRCNAGKGAIPHLKNLCDALNARLLDLQTGEFADFSTNTENSLRAFADWRDRALSEYDKD